MAIPSQLVGVVGPNGCGKSNIIDAVRWVLGESRASELRGESMQDVIFNGSAHRKPAGRASVELIFDNSAGRAMGQWSSYSEIAVRRILTRDGTSSYLINGQQVRRRDIYDLFLGTGLGSRGYAIIGQGMINRLIEAKPEELRVYLEEAAGVSRYKERRRETENRLADTADNLTRVEDILSELSNQLEHLEKQAAVARRYKDLQAEGEQKQHLLWYIREQQAQQSYQTHKAQIAEQTLKLESSIAQLRHAEAEVESRRQSHHDTAEDMHRAQAAMYEASSLVSRLEAEQRHVTESMQRLVERQQQLTQQRQEWHEQDQYNQERLEALSEDKEVIQAKQEQAHIDLETLQQQLPQLETDYQQQQQQREQLRTQVHHVERQIALLQQQVQGQQRQSQQLAQRQERLRQEKNTLQSPDHARLEQLQGEQDLLQQSLQEAQARLQELEEQIPDLEQARQAKQAQLQQAQQHHTRLESRWQALQKLQEDVLANNELEPWLKQHGFSQAPRLLGQLQIEAGWETALEAVLREKLTALQVQQLQQLCDLEAQAPKQRLVFFCKTMQSVASPSTGQFKPLLSLLHCADPDVKAVLSHWLQHVYLADSIQGALDQRDQWPAQACFVLKSGHMVDACGVSFYAADSEQAGMLSRQQEIKNLQFEIKAQALIIEQCESAAARANNQLQQVQQSMPAARQRLSELTTRQHHLQLEHSQLSQQIAQAEKMSQRLDEEWQELSLQAEEVQASLAQHQLDLEELQAQAQEQAMQLDQSQEQEQVLQAQLQSQRQQVHDAEKQLQEMAYEARALNQRQAELQRNQELAARQVQQHEHELATLTEQLDDYDAQAAQAALQDALEERAIKEEHLQASRIELENLEALLRQAEETRLQLEQSIQPSRDAITQLQLDEQAARLQMQQFAEQIDLQAVDRQQMAQFLQDKDQEWSNPRWLQSEVQKVSKQIDGLGAVNLAALEELQQAQARKAFLDQQQDDLQKAIDTLEEAIRKIDRETRELLQATFNQVNGHFAELFPRLFGGGEAKLIMTGDEILDAGVQVMAQPPGKRNSTIHLLSGGEKALTATALVFALFKLNPAPFCLLDEVDAPLDDANTGRYANLVESMSDQTQFLFISHNKIAMQIAKQLIGVTMQEQGVSRIVAVDVEAAVHLVNQV